MAYDPNVLRRAVDRLEGERRRRRVELDRLRDRVYGREPRKHGIFFDREAAVHITELSLIHI